MRPCSTWTRAKPDDGRASGRTRQPRPDRGQHRCAGLFQITDEAFAINRFEIGPAAATITSPYFPRRFRGLIGVCAKPNGKPVSKTEMTSIDPPIWSKWATGLRVILPNSFAVESPNRYAV